MKALMLLAVYEGFSGAKRGVRSVLMRTVPSRRADAVGSSGPKSREDPSLWNDHCMTWHCNSWYISATVKCWRCYHDDNCSRLASTSITRGWIVLTGGWTSSTSFNPIFIIQSIHSNRYSILSNQSHLYNPIKPTHESNPSNPTHPLSIDDTRRNQLGSIPWLGFLSQQIQGLI